MEDKYSENNTHNTYNTHDTHNTHVYRQKKIYKIGIDFGGTIGGINEQQSLDTFNIIKMIINKYTSSNVFIISKASDEMREKIIIWMRTKIVNTEQNFFDITGFNINNIIFVYENEEKRDHIIKHDINVFIDDNIKIIKNICNIENLEYIIWFSKPNLENLNCFPKKYRNKITISKNWNKIWSYKWNRIN